MIEKLDILPDKRSDKTADPVEGRSHSLTKTDLSIHRLEYSYAEVQPNLHYIKINTFWELDRNVQGKLSR